MLTVDEASAFTGFSCAVIAPFVALVRARHAVRLSGAQPSNFFSRSALASLGLGLASMALSAVPFHFLLGDRYNHMALGVWSIAFVAILIGAPAASAVASAILSWPRRYPGR